jgi:hypothetical protein
MKRLVRGREDTRNTMDVVGDGIECVYLVF